MGQGLRVLCYSCCHNAGPAAPAAVMALAFAALVPLGTRYVVGVVKGSRGSGVKGVRGRGIPRIVNCVCFASYYLKAVGKE